MRHKLNINLFRSGSSFCDRGIFSGSVNQKVSPALNVFYRTIAVLPTKKLLCRLPKDDLRLSLHRLISKLQNNQGYSYCSSVAISQHRFLFNQNKNSKLLNRLQGTALCDIKTKYAQKKRNPRIAIRKMRITITVILTGRDAKCLILMFDFASNSCR